MSATECPSRDLLVQLLNDGGGADRDALEQHIGECGQCQRQIQELAVADTVWAEWDDRLKTGNLNWPGQTHHEREHDRPVDSYLDRDTWPAVPGYEILDVLGAGGMGIVFKARQLTLDRLVALKTVPLSGSGGGALRSRLRREAETLAQLHHPHVVQIFEILESDGSVVLALELIHGGSLADRLKDSTLKPDESARLVELLARTMHVAHQSDILHRDLKPANVLLTSDGIPKITDFGLARRLEVPGDTNTGHIIGTPSYLAPEQAQGREGWSTPAVDIYGLGAVLYECLTGRPPFRAASSFETLRQVVQEEPASPSRLQPRLPRDLVTICLKCLQKEPSRRYTSCLELAEDLQRFQTGVPIRARRTPVPVRFVKWTRRHPLVASLGGAFLVTLVILVGLWGKYTRDLAELNTELRTETVRANSGQRQAEAARENAEFERRKAIVMLMQLDAAMRQNASLTRRAPGDPGRLSLFLPLESYIRVLTQFNSGELRREKARGFHWVGGAYRVGGDAEKASYYFQRAIQIHRGIDLEEGGEPRRNFELARFLSDFADIRLKLRDYTGAAKALREAEELLDDPQTVPDPAIVPEAYLRAEIGTRQATLDLEQGRPKAAREKLTAARDRLKQLDAELSASRQVQLLQSEIDRKLSTLTGKPVQR